MSIPKYWNRVMEISDDQLYSYRFEDSYRRRNRNVPRNYWSEGNGWIQDDEATLVNLGPTESWGGVIGEAESQRSPTDPSRCGSTNRYLNGSADFHSRDDGKRMEGRYDLRHRLATVWGWAVGA